MTTYSAIEAARLIGKSERTIRKWLDKGKLEGKIVYVDGLRQWAIPEEEIARIVEQSRKDTGTSLETRLRDLERRVAALEAANHPRVTRQRKGSVTPLSDTQPSTSLEQPPGTLLLADFAARIGVERRKLLEIVMRMRFSHTAIPTNRAGEFKRYFDKSQRETVIKYLDARGIEHK